MLPALYRIYGLSWRAVADMPPGELAAVIADLDGLTSPDRSAT